MKKKILMFLLIITFVFLGSLTAYASWIFIQTDRAEVVYKSYTLVIKNNNETIASYSNLEYTSVVYLPKLDNQNGEFFAGYSGTSSSETKNFSYGEIKFSDIDVDMSVDEYTNVGTKVLNAYYSSSFPDDNYLVIKIGTNLKMIKKTGIFELFNLNYTGANLKYFISSINVKHYDYYGNVNNSQDSSNNYIYNINDYINFDEAITYPESNILELTPVFLS